MPLDLGQVLDDGLLQVLLMNFFQDRPCPFLGLSSNPKSSSLDLRLIKSMLLRSAFRFEMATNTFRCQAKSCSNNALKKCFVNFRYHLHAANFWLEHVFDSMNETQQFSRIIAW